MEEKIEKLIKQYEECAEKNGHKLNPNPAIVKGVIRGLLLRKENFGAMYCPCRKMSGNKKEDKNIICPCVYRDEEIEKDGHCYCNLFVK